MRIVVTGGSGLIGSWLVDRLVRRGDDVISVSKSVSPHQHGLSKPTSEVVGDLANLDLVKQVMSGGVDAVVHLAANVAPAGVPARDLLISNALSTLIVLEAAADEGIRVAVIASSISILGMAWAPNLIAPDFVPVDEGHPLRPTEGYALAKEFDEAIARMVANRWGMTVIALRFSYVGTENMIEDRLQNSKNDVRLATVLARELWGYLDVRDAAIAIDQALLAAMSARVSGAVVLNVVADDVLSDEELPALLARWFPSVALTELRHRGAYDVTRARLKLGFEAVHLRKRFTLPR